MLKNEKKNKQINQFPSHIEIMLMEFADLMLNDRLQPIRHRQLKF